jgi:enoyl-CoA hydratase
MPDNKPPVEKPGEEHRSLRVERAGSIAEVVLIGPGRGNAMGPDFWREVPRVFRALDRDASVRAIVVRGSNANFSYGLDLVAMGGELGSLLMGTPLAKERTELLDLIGEMQEAFDAVAECRKPVIAAIAGWCIGGGLDLAAACDVRLATTDARFSLREVKVAMVADLGSLQRLPPIIGEGHTRELALTGRDIDAARALRIGLVNDVYEGEAALLEAARALAKQITDNPPLVVQGIKRVMSRRTEREAKDGLATVALWNAAFIVSEDLREALTAFASKRPPKYEGK